MLQLNCLIKGCKAMRLKSQKCVGNVVVGPFNKWEDVPELTLMRVIDEHENNIVYKPDCVSVLIELGGDFSGWNGKDPPPFKFEVLPDDFEITICQE
jgi:hypothetical protein